MFIMHRRHPLLLLNNTLFCLYLRLYHLVLLNDVHTMFILFGVYGLFILTIFAIIGFDIEYYRHNVCVLYCLLYCLYYLLLTQCKYSYYSIACV